MLKLTEDLNEFNRRMAAELRSTFAPSVRPYQCEEDGTLLFRGPIAGKDTAHIGTHVSVSLEKQVVAEVNGAEPSRREEMIQDLLANLGTQVRFQYDPNKIGPYALQVTGTMRTLTGKPSR